MDILAQLCKEYQGAFLLGQSVAITRPKRLVWRVHFQRTFQDFDSAYQAVCHAEKLSGISIHKAYYDSRYKLCERRLRK